MDRAALSCFRPVAWVQVRSVNPAPRRPGMAEMACRLPLLRCDLSVLGFEGQTRTAPRTPE